MSEAIDFIVKLTEPLKLFPFYKYEKNKTNIFCDVHFYKIRTTSKIIRLQLIQSFSAANNNGLVTKEVLHILCIII